MKLLETLSVLTSGIIFADDLCPDSAPAEPS